jgi:hypothetical protein
MILELTAMISVIWMGLLAYHLRPVLTVKRARVK